jgi:hypothetical protein
MSYLRDIEGKLCDCDDTHNEGPKWVHCETNEVGEWKTCAYCGTTLLDLNKETKDKLTKHKELKND